MHTKNKQTHKQTLYEMFFVGIFFRWNRRNEWSKLDDATNSLSGWRRYCVRILHMQEWQCLLSLRVCVLVWMEISLFFSECCCCVYWISCDTRKQCCHFDVCKCYSKMRRFSWICPIIEIALFIRIKIQIIHLKQLTPHEIADTVFSVICFDN